MVFVRRDIYLGRRVLQSVRVKSPRPASPRAVHAVILYILLRPGAATCSRGDRRMPLWTGLTHSLFLPLSLSLATIRDSRNTGIRSQTRPPRERVSRFPAVSRCASHDASDAQTPFGSFSPPASRPSPLSALPFRRSNTCKNSHGRWLLHGSFIYTHTSTAYIASHADDCVAFVYIRLGSRLWGGGVQVGFRLAGTCILQHRALGDCAGRTRDAPGAVIYLGSRLALSRQK